MLLGNICWVFFLSQLGGTNNALVGCNKLFFSIGTTLRGAVQPVLDKLASVRGIDRAIFITEHNEVFQSGEVDKLGVLANLHALVARATVWQPSVLSWNLHFRYSHLNINNRKGPYATMRGYRTCAVS